MSTFICRLVCLLSVLGLSVDVVAAIDSRTMTEELSRAIEDVRRTTQDSRKDSDTLSLTLSDLRASLASSRYVDPKTLQAIHQKLARLLSGNVRMEAQLLNKLQELTTRLDIGDIRQWPGYCNVLAGQASLFEARNMTAERERLAKRLGELRSYFSGVPNASWAMWEEYFLWPETISLLSAAERDPLLLNRLQTRWTNAGLACDEPVLDQTAAQVLYLVGQGRLASGSRKPEAWAAMLRELGERLSQFSAKEDATILARIAQLTSELEQAGIAPELTAAIRRRFSQPNFSMVLSAECVKRNLSQTVNESFDIDDAFAGVASQGSGRLTGKVAWVPMPSPIAMRWKWDMDAVSRSTTTGSSQGVRVDSQGTTSIRGWKFFHLDAAGFAASPATASAQANVTFGDIAAGGGRIRRNATVDRVYAKQRQAEADAAAAAERSTRDRFDAEGEQFLKRARKLYDNEVRLPLAANFDFLSTVTCESTASEFRWNCRMETLGGFAAPTAPPAIAKRADLKILAHQTFLERYFAVRLRGREMNVKDLAGLLGYASRSPLATAPADADAWHCKWSADAPLGCTFSEGAMRLEFRLSEFTSPEGSFPGLVVQAEYRPRDGGLGGVFVRNGELTVLPLGFDPAAQEKLTGRQLVLRQAVRRRLDAVLGREFTLGNRDISLATQRPVSLTLSGVACENGWFVAWCDLREKTASAPTGRQGAGGR